MTPISASRRLNSSRSSVSRIAEIGRAEHLDAQPLEGPALRQREAAVERGLSAEAQQNAIALLPLQDPLDVVRRDRDEVNLVRQPFAGLDRGDIRVHQDRVDAFLAQGLNRLGPGVVELARLADLQRARAEQQDAAARFMGADAGSSVCLDAPNRTGAETRQRGTRCRGDRGTPRGGTGR